MVGCLSDRKPYCTPSQIHDCAYAEPSEHAKPAPTNSARRILLRLMWLITAAEQPSVNLVTRRIRLRAHGSSPMRAFPFSRSDFGKTARLWARSVSCSHWHEARRGARSGAALQALGDRGDEEQRETADDEEKRVRREQRDVDDPVV